jgi:Ca-activated chloride channel family protein
MNYKILTFSFLAVFATACSTDPASEEDLTQHNQQKLEERERARDLIDTMHDLDSRLPAEQPVSEDVFVVAGNEPRADTPAVLATPEVKIDEGHSSIVTAGQVTAHREQAGKNSGPDARHIVAPFVPPVSQATLVARQEQLRRGNEPLYREQYQRPEDHRVIRVTDNAVSTFSIDVDTGAYTNTRRWLNQGQLPPEDAVRVEEFINYFDYDYPVPRNRETPFLVETEIAPTPWNTATHLLRVGIQGYEVPKNELPCSNLVFLIDVSGSMRSPDKLPLLKQALGMLTRNLSARDRISMVVYAGASGVVLPPTPGHHKAVIMNALNQLEAGGSTNGAAGIRLAYQLAQQNFQPNGVNRVILATDGDFNVGMASTTELIDMIQRKREAGIALTTLGFGSGNYNDHMLEQLADEGNGNYAYIDKLSEAQKVLGDEMTSTLMTIAKDVKIQIEFNPSAVSEYRLIGYENRILNEEDFNNDKIDAGEIGAGHRVTAIYEISLAGSGYQRIPDRRYGSNGVDHERRETTHGLANELAHLRIRYKQPGQDHSQLIQAPVMRNSILSSASKASDNFRFAAAVAAFGQKLRGGQFLESMDYPDIAELARKARGNDRFGYRSEFVQLVSLAEMLDASNNVAREDYGR